MQAFVTGSTGLLGSNLVMELLRQGWTVKALVRSPEKAKKLFGDLPVHYVVGDMENVAGFAPEMAGSDVLFHTAAYFREYFGNGDHWAQLEKINVHGTMQLLDAAEKYGIQKVIYTSSSGVIGKGANGQPGDESTPPDADLMQQLYFRSKVVAEEKIMAWLKTHRLPVVLILPTAMFGPADAAPTGAGQFILNFLHGQIPAVPTGGFTTVDVRDVVQGMIAAVDKGRSGERYIIGNRYYSAGEIMSLLSEITGVPKPRLPLPYPAAIVFAVVSGTFARLRGREPMVSVNSVKTLALRRDVKSDKARRELDVTIRPFEDTLRDEVQWYIDHGYIKTSKPLTLRPVTARS